MTGDRDDHTSTGEVESAVRRGVSRRNLLAAGTGLGAAGLAGLLASTPAGAAVAAPSSTAPSGDGVELTGLGPFGTSTRAEASAGASASTIAITPVPVVGATIRTITANTFVAAGVIGSDLGGVLGPPVGAYNTTGSALFAPLDIPTGAHLKQVDCYGYSVGTPTPFAWSLLTVDNVGGLTQLDPDDGTGGPGVTRIAFTDLDLVVGPGMQVIADLLASSDTHYALAVTYQFVPATPGFHPIAPVRVYDSRYNNPTGPVPAGGNRLISVADGYTQATNVVSVADVVPAGAVAIAYNLTVTDTSASGYLQLAPGSATAVSGSSINWSAGQTIANGGVVAVDATRHVKAFAVGGAASVIVDVQGYYL